MIVVLEKQNTFPIFIEIISINQPVGICVVIWATVVEVSVVVWTTVVEVVLSI